MQQILFLSYISKPSYIYEVLALQTLTPSKRSFLFSAIVRKKSTKDCDVMRDCMFTCNCHICMGSQPNKPCRHMKKKSYLNGCYLADDSWNNVTCPDSTSTKKCMKAFEDLHNIVSL